jgi:MraZ protein
MAVSYGTFYLKLDEKGRIILPAKVRPDLLAGTYLTRGQDHCLFLFSETQFEAYRDQMSLNAPPGMPAIAFDRVFFSSVVNGSMDKQGRLMIPPNLRTYAGLVRDLAVVGLTGRLEIWDVATWESYVDYHETDYASLREGVR